MSSFDASLVFHLSHFCDMIRGDRNQGEFIVKVLVLNGSPSGKDSITLQTVKYIEIYFPKVTFEVLHVGRQIKKIEKDFAPVAGALQAADLILFAYPVYTFLVPAQLHRFIELIKENGVDLKGKYATQLTTSKHFYDTTAHRFIQDICDDLGMHYVRGLSADMEDLMSRKGQQEALSFFRYVLWSMKGHFYETPNYLPDICKETFRPVNVTEAVAAGKSASARRIAIVADLQEGEAGERLAAMIRRFEAVSPISCSLVNIRAFPFAGGCLGCFHCAADGKCIYKDGFDDFLRQHIQTSDAIVYAYKVRDHSMGSRFKTFDDRQFCNGHRTVTMGKPVGYLVDGLLSCETNLQELMQARSQVGGNFLAGIASNEKDPDREIDQLAAVMAYAIDNDYDPPKNFYGVGGLKIFRDLIYQMQGLMKEDHRFYKAHGFYDFPQKRMGTIAGMYLVGAMMTNEKLKKKIGGKMTEGMLMPYQKVLEKAKRRKKHNKV